MLEVWTKSELHSGTLSNRIRRLFVTRCVSAGVKFHTQQFSSIYRIRRSEHITSALISLHWLRVPERISFKLSVMTYRSIHGTFPSYLQSCFTRVADISSRRRLRSSTSHRLEVPPFVSLQSANGISGFCREQPASPRRICAVTRRVRTRHFSIFPFLPKFYYVTYILLLSSSLYFLNTYGPCTN